MLMASALISDYQQAIDWYHGNLVLGKIALSPQLRCIALGSSPELFDATSQSKPHDRSGVFGRQKQRWNA